MLASPCPPVIACTHSLSRYDLVQHLDHRGTTWAGRAPRLGTTRAVDTTREARPDWLAQPEPPQPPRYHRSPPRRLPRNHDRSRRDVLTRQDPLGLVSRNDFFACDDRGGRAWNAREDPT